MPGLLAGARDRRRPCTRDGKHRDGRLCDHHRDGRARAAHVPHTFQVDEGPELGGKHRGPAPYDLAHVCRAQQWPVTPVEVTIRYSRDGDAERLDRMLLIEGADAEQKKRMAEIAERTPVTLTLKKGMPITTTLG